MDDNILPPSYEETQNDRTVIEHVELPVITYSTQIPSTGTIPQELGSDTALGQKQPNSLAAIESIYVKYKQATQGYDPQKSRFTVPDGFKVLLTKRGHPYIIQEDKGVDSMEIRNEHNEARLPITAKWSKLENEYGLGIKLYFDFARMVIVVNTILFIIQLMNIVPHIIVDLDIIRSGLTLSSDLINQLYTSSYSPEMYWIWIATNSVCIIISLAFGPVYWLIVKQYYSKRDLYDIEEDILDKDMDNIKGNENISSFEKFCRFLFSYFLFFLFMVIAFAITVGFTILQNVNALYEMADSTFTTNNSILTGISIAISAIVGIMNYIWKLFSVKLTNFERHQTWSGYRKHNTFKFLFFKLFSVFVMGLTKGFFATPCVMTALGNQYLIQMLLDFFVFNTIELVMPYIIYRVKKYKNKGGNNEIRPDFDVAEEYLELIYRQYIIYCGFTSFPLVTLIGLLASICELYLDKLRLLKLCHRPPITTGSVKTVVAIFLLISALLPILNWGGGNVYPLTGYYWCNSVSEIQCMDCRIVANGRYPNLIKAMFEG
ncbi:hypothetical protein ABK040_010301 [Willaertia magna]